MLIGLHVSAAGGVENAPKRAAAEGGEVVQIFAGSPRTWKKTIYTKDQGAAFRQAMRKHNIQQAFVHVMYLTSYGTPDDEHRQKSIDAFITALENCDALDCIGAITHLGSHKGNGFGEALPRIADSLKEVLDSDTHSYLILENSAGSGGNIGNSFEDMARIIEACDKHPRLKICLDTAHAFTAGYDLRTQAAWDVLVEEFDNIIGLDRLAVMHLNDSKADFLSRVDRHENIGDGHIGEGAFAAILNDRRLQSIAGILEVPGLDGTGPDRANVDRLKELRNQ